MKLPEIFQDDRTQLWGIGNTTSEEVDFYNTAGITENRYKALCHPYGGIFNDEPYIWFATKQMCEVWRAFVAGMAQAKKDAEATK